jgi:hypothetical protein
MGWVTQLSRLAAGVSQAAQATRSEESWIEANGASVLTVGSGEAARETLPRVYLAEVGGGTDEPRDTAIGGAEGKDEEEIAHFPARAADETCVFRRPTRVTARDVGGQVTESVGSTIDVGGALRGQLGVRPGVEALIGRGAGARAKRARRAAAAARARRAGRAT